MTSPPLSTSPTVSQPVTPTWAWCLWPILWRGPWTRCWEGRMTSVWVSCTLSWRPSSRSTVLTRGTQAGWMVCRGCWWHYKLWVVVMSDEENYLYIFFSAPRAQELSQPSRICSASLAQTDREKGHISSSLCMGMNKAMNNTVEHQNKIPVPTAPQDRKCLTPSNKQSLPPPPSPALSCLPPSTPGSKASSLPPPQQMWLCGNVSSPSSNPSCVFQI